jgi:hypothetical protein
MRFMALSHYCNERKRQLHHRRLVRSSQTPHKGGAKRRRARVIKLHSDRIFLDRLSSPIKADQNASNQKRAVGRGTVCLP